MSVTTLHPTATITPNSTPVAEAEPNNDDTYFTHATNLGTVAPGLDAVGTGNVKYYLDEVDTWGFHVATDGIAVALSLDGFDDGTGKDHVALDLYDSNNNLIDSSAGNTPLDQITDILPAGDYHVAVYAITDGSDGDYRLVLRAGGATATPTSSPTVTPTPPCRRTEHHPLISTAAIDHRWKYIQFPRMPIRPLIPSRDKRVPTSMGRALPISSTKSSFPSPNSFSSAFVIPTPNSTRCFIS